MIGEPGKGLRDEWQITIAGFAAERIHVSRGKTPGTLEPPGVNHFHERLTIMTTILALDLGKFKSVCCFFNLADGEVRYVTVESTPASIGLLLDKAKAEGVVCAIFEACVLTGWVARLCDERGLKRHIAATNGEAWRWKNVKRKTDRDDALKLTRFYHQGELP